MLKQAVKLPSLISESPMKKGFQTSCDDGEGRNEKINIFSLEPGHMFCR